MSSTSQTITAQSYGQKMILKTGEDLTGQTALKFYFKNEEGTVLDPVTASCDDEEGGDIYWLVTQDYWFTNGDVGTWKVIGEVTYAAGKLYTRPVELYIVDQWTVT